MNETHTGTGQMITDGTEHSCQYHLEIRTSAQLKTGSGFVVSTPAALWAAFEARRCVVRMNDGRSFPIIVTRYSPGDEDAPFRMAGGFIEEAADEA